MNRSIMIHRTSLLLLARLVAMAVTLGSAAAGSVLAQVSGTEAPTYRFNHVPFEGAHWVYLRREVSAVKGAWSEDMMARGGHIHYYRARRLMTVRNAGPVAERYIDVRFDVLEKRKGLARYQPVDSLQIGEGRYQLIGTPEEGTILQDGAPYDHPTEAVIRSALSEPWDWEVVAEHLDGSIWRVGEIRAFSPAEMKHMRFADYVIAAHLELRSVGYRLGRSVAEFVIKTEKDNEQVLSSDRVMYIDIETVRPILQTYTNRGRAESVNADGERYFEAYHLRTERIYRFNDILLYKSELELLPSGFETPGDDNRAPIDIGITGRGDMLYILDRARGAGTGTYQDRVGAWDILSRRPIAALSLHVGEESRLIASRSDSELQLQTPYTVTIYGHRGTNIWTTFHFINGGLEDPKLTASVNIGNYTVLGDDSGRVRLAHIGWLQEYGRIQVSQAPILAIAASPDQGDTGKFVTLDGAGDVRRHGVAEADASPCQVGSDLFYTHCHGLGIDIDVSSPLANVAETGCVSETSETLVISPRGEMIGWTDFETVDGECVRTGSSWLIETADAHARKVAGAGLTFVDDSRFLTGAGLFERSTEAPTVTLESTLPFPVDFEREVLKSAVSDSYQTAYFLINQAPRANYVVEVDLGTGVVAPIWMHGVGSQPRALGISNNELFTLMSDGSVISEFVTDGRIHHYPPARRGDHPSVRNIGRPSSWMTRADWAWPSVPLAFSRECWRWPPRPTRRTRCRSTCSYPLQPRSKELQTHTARRLRRQDLAGCLFPAPAFFMAGQSSSVVQRRTLGTRGPQSRCPAAEIGHVSSSPIWTVSPGGSVARRLRGHVRRGCTRAHNPRRGGALNHGCRRVAGP